VSVFIFALAIVGPAPARAQETPPGGGTDPFVPPVHSEEIRAQIDLIRADYIKKSDEIDREAERLTADIISADDPAASRPSNGSGGRRSRGRSRRSAT
jgi:hypothetical protein